MKAVNDIMLGKLVKKLKEYINDKCAQAGGGISRLDGGENQDLQHTQSYPAALKAKIFIVAIGTTKDVDATCTVCIDFWQIPKGDSHNSLKIVLPLEDADGDPGILYAYRESSGVPVFETEGILYIKGVASYI